MIPRAPDNLNEAAIGRLVGFGWMLIASAGAQITGKDPLTLEERHERIRSEATAIAGEFLEDGDA